MSSLGSDSAAGAGMSGSVRARLWVMLAQSIPRQVQKAAEAPAAEKGDLPFQFASRETGTF